MMKSFLLASLVFCSSLSAAPMVRVIGARSATVLTIDRNGIAEDVTLAQVIVAPAETGAATEYLRRSLAGAWVLIETDADGRAYVYRSPDGLFVNGALARRAWLDDHVHMTYLGESDPAPQRARAQSSPAPAAKAARLQPPRIPRIRAGRTSAPKPRKK